MSTLPLSTSDITQEVQVRQLTGAGSQATIPSTTIMQNFDECVKSMGDKPALHQKVRAPVRESTDKRMRMNTDRVN
jgi:hypothetical protein